MSTLSPEFEEIRLGIERLRAMLESLVVRGLRACGTDELLQLKSFADYFDRCGAGHVSSILATLHSQIEQDDRASAQTLLKAQVSVRLLERLLTLRVVQGDFQSAALAKQVAAAQAQGDDDNDDDGDEDEE